MRAARKDGPRVRLYSRPGNDLTHRFPLIVDALTRLRSRSCIIDGEAVACDDNGASREQTSTEPIFLPAQQIRHGNPHYRRRCDLYRWRPAYGLRLILV